MPEPTVEYDDAAGVPVYRWVGSLGDVGPWLDLATHKPIPGPLVVPVTTPTLEVTP